MTAWGKTDFPRGLHSVALARRREKVKNSSQNSVWDASRVKPEKLNSKDASKKDTASPCSFASSVVSLRVLSGTSLDASEEVSCSALVPMC